MRKPFLSVIIPAHNEERRLSVCLEQVIPYLSTHFQNNHEIIIVDNGSTDETFTIARCYSATYSNVFALNLPIRGKGIAIKKGMLFAQGRFRYMCDVDLSTPIEALPNFLKMTKHFDVVIGSRELKSSHVQTSLKRRIMGRAFHLLAYDLVYGVLDTQCGFKLFRDVAANAIFGNLRLPGLAFDVEALYLARLLGYSIGEIPVYWQQDDDSRVRLLWDSLDMARDVISIPWLHTNLQLGTA